MKPGTGKEFTVDVGGTSGERTKPPTQGPVPDSGQHRESSLSGGAANSGQKAIRHDPNFSLGRPAPFDVGQSRGAGQGPVSQKRR